ncbi:glycosyl transferase family 2 [Thermaerobacter marianensis DSM 12885]|uniref:Glucosyl-3-phosphoglycerate synthase n=1 Tax=Thermaerobacter marianensis (strain ATCC 700841 / DSM 12885 / JCM 10246 / 7p75a) TaxID=644966 RepID=E6SKQ9_THEM7|nr:glycosyltransferase [Thermaerobacter marianensis]ADU51267.1 glycosyl transferase family 2 [Thermaerobacter marianensis DSM 12885]
MTDRRETAGRAGRGTATGGAGTGPAAAVEAVVPAFNEAASVAATVEALAACPRVVAVWVVDDGSTDGTAAAARAAGARVVRLSQRCGKGRALMAGAACTTAPWLLFADADLGPSARNLAALVDQALAGAGDMLIAAPPRRPGRNGFGAAVALARWGVARLGGRVLAAPLSGQRVLRREIVDLLDPVPPGWGIEVALTLTALRAGLEVVEVPLAIAHRVTGWTLSGLVHRGHQLWHVARTLAGYHRRSGRPVGPRRAVAP